MSIDLSIITNYGPQLLLGFWMTIKIVVGAIILGMPFGLVLALGRRSRLAIIRFFATSFIEVFRNTPFIIQVFMLFYVLPFYGLHLPAEYVGVVALAAFGSAYFAEVIRGGIDAVAKGQLESARATGMSDWQAMRYIILPQTLPIILPAMTNQTLSLVKESAILSTITVGELTMAAITVQGETFRPFEAFIMVALLYWALNETLAIIMRRVERKVSRRTSSSSRAKVVRAAPAATEG
ncbi:MAG: amino acid ABC transporter permease [Roseibium album]|uniref:Inner membrane amino-acid ABC transporter permease protein YecS n=1 Tax=Roseibium album TaxID=311410 RepID=A0A0M7ABC9_9HYPH|nr:amino acid ABC transporter permease [Roseibium album]MBG6157352.1 His/Glu/Gln/Arg/opine family amino acid ABC transporter permease subunit [Labrenzia sp. EL_162]MBG6162713.1 His/Glu/Gln/Arg/opine family amino acid ABC transporter permease subunit [Labrenzia sp. EL_195]MBG6196254.1 His/Glu/Gln/Arg/opine family amino acid ABC transporter permease subunit [Labrenzia sp. EL_159]MBG6201681.1 His/Glu/Gln/Arg/opine family amino acid ABC transporter permease subunit [Labrenzia sp. EL_13]CTQ58263.1 